MTKQKRNHLSFWVISALAAGSNVEILAKQAVEFNVGVLSVKSFEDAEKLRNCLIKVHRDDEPKLPEDTYYIVDLLT